MRLLLTLLELVEIEVEITLDGEQGTIHHIHNV